MTSEEWRTLLDRCVRAGREDMLDSIRAILTGRVALEDAPPGVMEMLVEFCELARRRWHELTDDLPVEAPARFPQGYYEMGFGLIGARPAAGLGQVNERLGNARRVKLTGWTPFLDLHGEGRSPYPHDDYVEAWVGRPHQGGFLPPEPATSDFWRADQNGRLYTIRGYSEDGLERVPPGQIIDLNLPIWRIAEGLLFAHRYAETFDNVNEIAIYCRFTGLNERRLDDSTWDYGWLGRNYTSRTPQVELRATATPDQVRDNDVEVVHQLLTPLYERFNFYPLTQEMVERQMTDLKKRHY